MFLLGTPDLCSFTRLQFENWLDLDLTFALVWICASRSGGVVLFFRAISGDDIQKCRVSLSRCRHIDPRMLELIHVIAGLVRARYTRIYIHFLKVLRRILHWPGLLLLLLLGGCLLLSKTVSLAEARGTIEGALGLTLAVKVLLGCDLNRIITKAATALIEATLGRHFWRRSHFIFFVLVVFGCCRRLVKILGRRCLLKAVRFETWLLFSGNRSLGGSDIINRLSKLVVVEKALVANYIVLAWL